MNVAVLSPHFDDAVLACWHVLEGPTAVSVVNVFTAAPPPGFPVPDWDRLTGATDAVVRMRERREEDRRALGLAGCTAVGLDLLDAQYRTGQAPTVRSLALRLHGLLGPGTVVLAPAGLGGHPDHVLVRDAALELVAHGRRVLLYADLPHAIRHGWPGWVTGDADDGGRDVGEDWRAGLAGAGLRVERLVPRVRVLDAAARARKLRALEQYETQRAALDGLAFLPLDDPRTLAFEVRWTVPASALPGLQQAARPALVADGGRQAPDDRG